LSIFHVKKIEQPSHFIFNEQLAAFREECIGPFLIGQHETKMEAKNENSRSNEAEVSAVSTKSSQKAENRDRYHEQEIGVEGYP